MNSPRRALRNGGDMVEIDDPRLIANAEIYGLGVADLRIENGRIAAIGKLAGRSGEPVLELGGAAALPGLNDHHIHLMAYAAALESVCCGPPEVRTGAQMIEALKGARPNKAGWIRGIGYHESVAGDIDRSWLDRYLPAVPLRIQHRSGRLWILNSVALQRLSERSLGRSLPAHRHGRFYDQDVALRELWGCEAPPIARASRQLAAYGVTGVTDLTPGNDTAAAAAFERLRCSGSLLQRLRVGGKLDLRHGLAGPTKVHLHESSLPDYAGLCDLIETSHGLGRVVAMHCVTEAELVFALAAFRAAGTQPGDRIEHASVTPPALLAQLRELGLLVVTQPHFIAERGDAYLRDVPAAEQAWLYRCREFLDRGIPLAGGSDAPFGHADPWRAMRAAIDRRTASGRSFGGSEALSAEQALALYLGALDQPDRPRRIEVGAPADLCLLDRPWREARAPMDSACVAATMRAGRILYRRGDRS